MILSMAKPLKFKPMNTNDQPTSNELNQFYFTINLFHIDYYTHPIN